MRRHAKAIVAISALLLLTIALSATFASATSPVVSIDAPTAVTYTSAHVTGKVDPEDIRAYYSFETSTDGGATWSGFSFQGPIAAGSGSTAVEADLTGLEPGTEYRVRLVANNFEDPEAVSSEQSFTTDPVGAPTVSIATPSAVTGSTAHLSGTINPQAPEAAPANAAVEAGFKVDWHFECTPECPGLSGGTVAADNSGHQVEADPTGLLPGTLYKVSLVAENSAGPVSVGPESFTTFAVAPTIGSAVSGWGATQATLGATVNPGGAATDYHFEYGPTASYGQGTPTESTPAGSSPVTVKATVLGLTPGSKYHFRLIATNSVSTVAGPDQSFTTDAAASADGCANAAIRAEQGTSGLTECRAYEMVSPPQKNGNAVDYAHDVQSSLDGNSVAFSSPGALSSSDPTSLIGTYYLGKRAASGWTTEPIDAPQSNRDSQIGSTTLYLSKNLNKTFQYSERALTSDAIEGGSLYLRDNLIGTRTFVAGNATTYFSSEMVTPSARYYMSASDDLSTIAFQSTLQLLPEAIPGEVNVYEYAEGELRLAGVLPDGTVDPEGSIMWGSSRQPHAVSADGSKVFFTAGKHPDGPLYARVNGTTTVPISVSRRAGDPSTPASARFAGASLDGKIVYFTTQTPLTDDVPVDPSSNEAYGQELYKYEFGTDTLTLAYQPPAEGSGIVKVNAVSTNGEYAYFSAYNQLAPGSVPIGNNFYVAHDGVVKFVASLAGIETGGPAYLALSPSGRYAAMVSGAQLTAADNTSPACKRSVNGYENPDGVCVEVYIYDAVTGSISCPGCRTVDGENRFSELASVEASISEHSPAAVMNDGRVFFNSKARLAEADTNGVQDVYMWDGQQSQLISSGRGVDSATFFDSSPDGSNAFFLTAGKLTAEDIDGDADLYDARIGGGLRPPVSPPPPCAGESCKGQLTSPPAQVAPGSSQLVGPGNKSTPRKQGAKCKKAHKRKASKSRAARCPGKKSHGKAKS